MTERTFLAELKRRNVIRVAIAYVAVSWLVMQASSLMVQTLELPNAISKGVFVLLVIAFIPTLVFSWIYELTPEGLKRESEIERDESITHLTGRRLDYLVIGVLAAVVALLLVDKFVLSPRQAARTAGSAAAAAQPAGDSSAAADGGTGAAASDAAAIPRIESDPSIAVLPLVNMSDDKANEYFSDGISEELLNLLAKVPKLRVIARTSSFAFKGEKVDITDVARKLHVAAVLEGSVRKSADKVRITVQLIRAVDGSHLWSETYDRTLDDIFKVQDEIAVAVVDQLQIKLLGAAPSAKPVDPRVYPLLLQAQALSDRGSPESRAESVTLARQVLDTAPDEARAWGLLARVYFNQVTWGELPAAEGVRLMKEAAEKAVALDPEDAGSHGTLARIAMDIDFDLPAAARHLKRALALEPGNLRAVNTAGILLSNIGRMDEALPMFEYRAAHDPANQAAHFNLGATYVLAGRFDDALASIRTAMRLSPDSAQAHSIVGMALLLGKHDAAGALEAFKSERHEVSRVIPADAAAIFAVVSSPAGHVAIDASGMLQDFTGEPATKEGDEFVIHMDREALGDLPMGKYDVTVTMTGWEQDRFLTWEVSAPGFPSIGHYYGYRLEPNDDGTTTVTSIYDWSNVDEEMKQYWPVVPLSALKATLGILERTVRSQTTAG